MTTEATPKQRVLHTCLKCSWQWLSKQEYPICCPKCRSHTWNKEGIIRTCLKCGHHWTQRKEDGAIRQCPSCNTILWDGRIDKRDLMKGIYGERTTQIIAMRKANPCFTLQQIADKCEVSRERVRQILDREGLPTKKYVQTYHCSNCNKQIAKNNKGGLCQSCISIIHSIPLVCKQCGTLFYRRQAEVIRDAKSQAYKGTGDFCSRKCYGKFMGIHYGFVAHPENKGRYRKYDYTKVIQQANIMRINGKSYSDIAKALNMPSGVLYNILLETHNLTPQYNQPIHKISTKIYIVIRWLQRLNFTHNEIAKFTPCAPSTVYRIIKEDRHDRLSKSRRQRSQGTR